MKRIDVGTLGHVGHGGDTLVETLIRALSLSVLVEESDYFFLEAGEYLADELRCHPPKKTGYTPPEGYQGFEQNKKKGKSRRY
jgi:hypothetical protein